MLTCFSAVLYLLSDFNRNGSVAPEDVSQMVGLTPTARLQELEIRHRDDARTEALGRLVGMYDQFLVNTDASEPELVERFSDRDYSRKSFEEAAQFGDEMYQALSSIGQNSKLHRLLVV